jgi:hypothetical protein
VQEAWDVVATPGLLQELIESMPARMEAVIIVGSDLTPWRSGKASGMRNGYQKPFTVYYNNVIK